MIRSLHVCNHVGVLDTLPRLATARSQPYQINAKTNKSAFS